jgi:hypothetical protein
MSSILKGKRTLWGLGLGLGVTVIGGLYSWLVYAGEIETDFGKIATEISQANSGSMPLDPTAITMETQAANTNEQQLNNAISAGLYSIGPLASDPTATRAANILTSHFSSYCMQGVEGSSCPSDVLLQYGDTKLSTLLAGTVYDAPRQAAATQFLYNLIPIPGKNLAPFLNSDGKTDVSQFPTTLPSDNPNSQNYSNPQQSFADALTDQATISIARQPYSEMIAKRTAPSGGGDSVMQMMERVAMQRHMSTAWAANLNPAISSSLTPTQAQTQLATQANNMLQEIALMQAYHVWLEYERYRQTERLEALLSALVIQNYKSGQAISSQVSSAPPASSATGAPAPAPSP